MTRMALSIILFLIVLSVVGCNGTLKVREPRQELSVNPVRLDSGLVDVEIKYTVTNPDENAVTFTFPSAKQWDAWVTSNGKEIFRESDGKMYAQSLTSIVLKPGESKTFTAVWRLSLEPGAYEEGTKYEVYAGLATKELVPLKVTAVPAP